MLHYACLELAPILMTLYLTPYPPTYECGLQSAILGSVTHIHILPDWYRSVIRGPSSRSPIYSIGGFETGLTCEIQK